MDERQLPYKALEEKKIDAEEDERKGGCTTSEKTWTGKEFQSQKEEH